MKTTLKRCLAILTLTLLSSACVLAEGAADFKARCAPCHGLKGAGETKLGQHLQVRDLGSADVQKQTDADLTAVIAKGKGRMPPYAGKLSVSQIADVVKFIRSLKK